MRDAYHSMMRGMTVGDIFFGSVAVFLFGIFAADIHWNIYLCGGIGILIGMIAVVLDHLSWKHLFIMIAIGWCGIVYSNGFAYWKSSTIRLPTVKQAEFFGIVTAQPKSTGNFILFPVRLLAPYSGSVDIFASSYNHSQYGDLIWVKGTPTTSGDGGELPAIFLPKTGTVTTHKGYWIIERLIAFRIAMIGRLNELLPQDQAGLLAGIILGGTNTVSSELKQQMEVSGTSYVNGMYGYKIAMITLLIAELLKDRISRRMLLLVTFMSMAGFVFVSGANISVVRAGIMGTFMLIARWYGREFAPRNALAFTAFGMTLFDPGILVDAGFQLSFLSFIGIYHLGQPIENLFHWTNRGFLNWKEHTMLSLSTNLAILPIVMNTFGGFSLTSFVSNILIMIPWPLALLFGITVLLLGSLSTHLIFFILPLLNIIMNYELLVIRVFAKFAVPLPSIFGSAFMIALYYGLVIIFAHHYASHTSAKE
jgi:ComEC/Rec2-related protein